MIRKQNISLQKVKINVTTDGFWVVPPFFRIFSPHSANYTIKKAQTLDEVINYNKLNLDNNYISFNKDHDFKLFNTLQKHSDLNVEINTNVINHIEKYHCFIFGITDKINLLFDEESLYDIYRGNSFLVNTQYFVDLLDYYKHQIKSDVVTFCWNKRRFVIWNDPN